MPRDFSPIFFKEFTNIHVNQTYSFKYLTLLFLFRYGLDLYGGAIRDNRKAGVLEPTISKIKSLKFATEAAITILRIDDLIRLEPERKDGGHHDME